MIAAAELQYAIIWTLPLILYAITAVAAVASTGLAIAQAAGAFAQDVIQPDIKDASEEASAARARNVLRQQTAFGFQGTRVADVGVAVLNLGTAVQIAPTELRELE